MLNGWWARRRAMGLTRKAAWSDDPEDRRRAVAAAERVAGARPRDVDAWANLGQALLGQAGQARDASLMRRSLDAFERAVALDAAHAKAHMGAAVALHALGDLVEDDSLVRAAIGRYHEVQRLSGVPLPMVANALRMEGAAWARLGQAGVPGASQRAAAARAKLEGVLAALPLHDIVVVRPPSRQA